MPWAAPNLLSSADPAFSSWSQEARQPIAAGAGGPTRLAAEPPPGRRGPLPTGTARRIVYRPRPSALGEHGGLVRGKIDQNIRRHGPCRFPPLYVFENHCQRRQQFQPDGAEQLQPCRQMDGWHLHQIPDNGFVDLPPAQLSGSKTAKADAARNRCCSSSAFPLAGRWATDHSLSITCPLCGAKAVPKNLDLPRLGVEQTAHQDNPPVRCQPAAGPGWRGVFVWGRYPAN